MKKQKKQKKQHGRRNAAPASAAPRRRFLPKRSKLPTWQDGLAAIVGAGGSSFVSGLLVNQQIAKPVTAASVMVGVGTAAALLADGSTRVAGTSMASAGTGQLALSWMGRRALAKQQAEADKQAAADKAARAAEKAAAEREAIEKAAAEKVAQAAAAQAAAAAQRPQSDRGGGYVTAMFRDASSELSALFEDGDADDGFDVVDLGDLAAA